MARMARGEHTAQWQAAGYYPEFDPLLTEDRLARKITYSKRVAVLLLNWLLNMLVAGGILLSGAGAVYAIVMIVLRIGDYIR